MLCPVCQSPNIDCSVIEIGDGIGAGAVQDGLMHCADCGASQDNNGLWVANDPPLYDPDLPPIYQFAGQHRFLSNFFNEPDDTCVEIEYQSAKCLLTEEALAIIGCGSAWKAKKLGSKVSLRADWEDVKNAVMYKAVRQKFADHSELRMQLKLTWVRELIEGNYWGDRYWGRVALGHGEGRNELGKILMRVRQELCKT